MQKTKQRQPTNAQLTTHKNTTNDGDEYTAPTSNRRRVCLRQRPRERVHRSSERGKTIVSDFESKRNIPLPATTEIRTNPDIIYLDTSGSMDIYALEVDFYS